MIIRLLDHLCTIWFSFTFEIGIGCFSEETSDPFLFASKSMISFCGVCLVLVKLQRFFQDTADILDQQIEFFKK